MKLQYWSKVLLELDTETGKIRIMQGFHQPVKGSSTKKKAPRKAKETVFEEEYM